MVEKFVNRYGAKLGGVHGRFPQYENLTIVADVPDLEVSVAPLCTPCAYPPAMRPQNCHPLAHSHTVDMACIFAPGIFRASNRKTPSPTEDTPNTDPVGLQLTDQTGVLNVGSSVGIHSPASRLLPVVSRVHTITLLNFCFRCPLHHPFSTSSSPPFSVVHGAPHPMVAVALTTAKPKTRRVFTTCKTQTTSLHFRRCRFRYHISF